jgi:hypothetical protein
MPLGNASTPDFLDTLLHAGLPHIINASMAQTMATPARWIQEHSPQSIVPAAQPYFLVMYLSYTRCFFCSCPRTFFSSIVGTYAIHSVEDSVPHICYACLVNTLLNGWISMVGGVNTERDIVSHVAEFRGRLKSQAH